jgi:Brp/Blh family beta-carotene 15,15'-monooxygenase
MLLFLAILSLWLAEASLLHNEQLQWGVFALVMVVSGIPHGAVDHLVYFKENKPDWKRFLTLYLGLIAFYGLLWFLLPDLSLAFFFLMTCYHFGQSEWHFIRLPEKHFLKIWIYLSWGAWLLFAFFYFNPEMSITILKGLINEEAFSRIIEQHGTAVMGLLSAAWSLPLGILLLKNYAEPDAIGFNLLLSLILFICIAKTPLPLSFALYFGGWHALKAIQMEREALFGLEMKSIWLWIKAAIPFSLLSLIGIGLLVWLAFSDLITMHPAMVFFIAISVLTLPHMVIMRGVYFSEKSDK